MGCWNGTCGITQLPIRAGEPVYGYILGFFSWEPIHRGFCYPTDIASPILLPFSGEYNDYGSIENIHLNDNTRLLSELVGIHPEKFEEWVFRTLTDREGASITIQFFSEDEPVRIPLGLWMCHKSVADSFLTWPDWDCKGNSREEVVKAHAKYTWDVLRERIEEANEQKTPFKRTLVSLLESLPAIEGSTGQPPCNMFLNTVSEGLFYAGHGIQRYTNDGLLVHLKYLLSNYGFTADTVQEFVQQVCVHRSIVCALSTLRKAWAPQCGAGSQQDDLEPYELLNGAVQEYINARRNKDWQEYGQYE